VVSPSIALSTNARATRRNFFAGQIEEVARYCESDVLNTYRVWLVYELFRGSIAAREHDWSETQVRDFVGSRKSSNPHLCKAVGLTEVAKQIHLKRAST
jgi:hypothetical protein